MIPLLVLTLAFGLEVTGTSNAAPEELADYSVTNWTEENSPLPLGVFAIAQDSEGFLWLGARDGLVRFDGMNFVYWNERARLPKERVAAVCSSRDGGIWAAFATTDGVSRIDKQGVTTYAMGDGLIGGYILALTEDQDGTIWAGGYGGLARFRDGRWQKIGLAQGFPAATVQMISTDRNGDLWIGSTAGIYQWAPAEDRFEFLAPNVVRDLVRDASGAIWVTDNEVVFKRLGDVLSNSQPFVSDTAGGIGRDLLIDRQGNLWVGSGGQGLIFLPKDAGESSKGLQRFRRRDGLGHDQVRTLFEDREGSIWVATRNGLSRLSHRIVTPVRGFGGDSHPFVYALASAPDRSLWLGTEEGLFRFRDGHVDQFGVADGLPGRVVTALHVDREGTLWVATTGGVAHSDHGRFLSVEGLSPTRSGIGLAQIRSITTDAGGRVWICDSSAGLLRWQNGRVELLNRKAPYGPPYVVYTDDRDRVWVGYLNTGVYVYDGDSVIAYQVNDGIPSGAINAIYQDSTGSIWVAATGGLRKFEDGRFRSFTANGMPELDVRSVVEDAGGYLWFGVTSGLLRVSLDEFGHAVKNPSHQLQSRLFGKEEGLSDGIGRPGTPNSARTLDDTLVFVTTAGIAQVQRDHQVVTPKVGHPFIDEVLVDGRSLLPGGDLQMGPGQLRLEIKYSVLSLGSHSNIRFRRKLEGLDRNWEDAGAGRVAMYSNLPPGHYRFRVALSNGEEASGDSDAGFDFSIRPTFYQTPLFFALCLAIPLAAAAAVWHLRVRFIRQRFELILGERSRVARALHDTLLQSLAAAALDFDDIADQLDPSEETLFAQVTHARKRVEHYVRETRQSLWNLRSPALERSGLVGAMREAGELTTSGTAVKFECIVKGSPSQAGSQVDEQLLRIGQEAITNAVQHADANHVQIEFIFTTRILTFRVSDDGRGFKLDTDYTQAGHWGLRSMRERAESVGAALVIDSQCGKGTIVEITVPVH